MKPVVASTAYLLISHGSRDPRPQEAMNRLADLVRVHLEAQLGEAQLGEARLDTQQATTATTSSPASLSASLSERSLAERHIASSNAQPATVVCAQAKPAQQEAAIERVAKDLLRQTKGKGEASQPTAHREPLLSPEGTQVIVGTACLELTPVPLSEQVYEFGKRLAAAGITELRLLPVFLMSGVHVMEDIPAEVNAAKDRLGDTIQVRLCPHLGSHTKITEVLANRLASVSAEGSLLVAHGSRRPKGNKAIRGLARRLDTAVAYWATQPDIETQVIELIQKGCQRLTILPYFLFAGGITDAIVHRTEELAERFPKVNFRLLPTLGATPEIADLAVELLYL